MIWKIGLMFILSVLCGALWSAWVRTKYRKNGF